MDAEVILCFSFDVVGGVFLFVCLFFVYACFSLYVVYFLLVLYSFIRPFINREDKKFLQLSSSSSLSLRSVFIVITNSPSSGIVTVIIIIILLSSRLFLSFLSSLLYLFLLALYFHVSCSRSFFPSFLPTSSLDVIVVILEMFLISWIKIC